MRNTFLRGALLAWLAALTLFAAAQQAGGPAGTWTGAIEIPGSPLEVSVTLTPDGEQWSGTIDIPAQGAVDLPLQSVAVDGDEVTFAIAGVPGEPTFTGTLDGDAITGDFTQAGQEFPFTLTRGADTEASGTAGPSQYEDPEGRYTVEVPSGWTVHEDDDHVTIESPEGGILVHLVVAETDAAEEAVARAWVDVADFDLEPFETLEPPSDSGVDRTVVLNYDAGDPQQNYQAVARVVDGQTYMLLVEAELSEVQRRNAQLQVVASSFEITAVDDDDLSGLTPGRVADVEEELETFVRDAMGALGVPGAAVAIVQDGEVVYSGGFGVKEAGGDEPVTPDTQMMIGSVGKSLTSLLTATLVDDGVIEWDTPVQEVLPEFAVADPEVSETMTIRNLLCACSGVPRRDLELAFNAAELSAEDIIESLETFEFFTDFGEAFQYSNQLVATAGYAAAAAAGAEYGELFPGYVEALQERVLEPIGLDDTTLSFEQVEERGDHATPHEVDLESGGYVPLDLEAERMLLPVAPAGVHWSTAEDMATYLLTLLQGGVTKDGERVVSQENLAVTWEPQIQVSADISYGLGWMIGEVDGLEVIFHGGNTLGFTSDLTLVPEADLGIVVLANAQGANAFVELVGLRLIELLYEQPSDAAPQLAFYAEQMERSLEETRERIQPSVDADEVKAFLGSYSNSALGTISLEMEDDQLVLDAGEFRTDVRPYLNRQGEFQSYVTYGGSASGLPVRLQEDEDGTRTVRLGEGAVSYTFEPAE